LTVDLDHLFQTTETILHAKKATPKRNGTIIKSIIVFNFSSLKRILGKIYLQATTIGKDSKEININPLYSIRYIAIVKI